MWTDVRDCYAFYETELGKIAQKAITQLIASYCSETTQEIIAGFGYTHPYLPYFSLEAERVFSMMPAPMGVMAWPHPQKNTSLLVCEQLPFRDQSIHRLLVVHALEYVSHTEKILEEFWRVLTPEGRLIVVVPNRRGLWSRSSQTPFGQGRPYTGRQLFSLIEQGNFLPFKPRYALYHPPVVTASWSGLGDTVEHMGEKWGKKFGGVVAIEAVKRVIKPVRSKQRLWQPRIFIPKPSITC